VNDELERTWQERTVASSWYDDGISLEGLRETKKRLWIAVVLTKIQTE
jgi:phage terminase large subunit-like protein